jgi:two-component system phosphate regulon sensor histidine kinase PhoR
VILLAAISIVGIMVTQVYWVRKAFDLRSNQFNRDVTTSLNNVALKLIEVNRGTVPSSTLVNQVSTNYFVVLVNGPIDASLLEFLLTTEFEKRNISHFEYGIYDCVDKCMRGGSYIAPTKTSIRTTFPETPRLSNDGYYFAVQFPLVEANILSQMGIWGFSTAVMLVVIFFFVYTLLVILKQKRLSEVQGDFINNMTHEFKTPISTIAISSQVLKDPTIVQQPDRLLSYATLIENENNRLRQQVDRVLQMAELDKKDMGLKKEPCEMHALIREAITHHMIALEATGGSIEFHTAATESTLLGDRLHLSNVVNNLIDNAIKYNHQTPRVVITTADSPTGLRIHIADNGIGIPVDAQKRIFERFYRVPTGNVHDVKGFGLGLHYVKTIIEHHGGSISVESKPGYGSTFSLQIPLNSR